MHTLPRGPQSTSLLGKHTHLDSVCPGQHSMSFLTFWAFWHAVVTAASTTLRKHHRLRTTCFAGEKHSWQVAVPCRSREGEGEEGVCLLSASWEMVEGLGEGRCNEAMCVAPMDGGWDLVRARGKLVKSCRAKRHSFTKNRLLCLQKKTFCFVLSLCYLVRSWPFMLDFWLKHIIYWAMMLLNLTKGYLHFINWPTWHFLWA